MGQRVEQLNNLDNKVTDYKSLDQCITDSVYSIHSILKGHQHKANKKQKTNHTRPIVFAYIQTSLGKTKPKRIKVLLDSGSTSTLVKKEYVKKLRLNKGKETTWRTMMGDFKTYAQTKVQFVLPELHEK